MTTHMDVKHISNRLNKNLIFKKSSNKCIIWFKKVLMRKTNNKIGQFFFNPQKTTPQNNINQKRR